MPIVAANIVPLYDLKNGIPRTIRENSHSSSINEPTTFARNNPICTNCCTCCWLHAAVVSVWSRYVWQFYYVPHKQNHAIHSKLKISARISNQPNVRSTNDQQHPLRTQHLSASANFHNRPIICRHYSSSHIMDHTRITPITNISTDIL